MNLKKILVMKTRPEIGDQEIHAMMDFKKVLDDHRNARKKNTIARLGFIGGAIVLALIAGYLLMPAGTQQAVVQNNTSPVIVDSVASDKTEPKVEEQLKQKDEPVVKALEKATTPKEVKKEDKPVTEIAPVYTEAEPVNGYPDLYAYFQKELKYPVEAMKDSIEGIVSVSFVINKEGKPEGVKILNSLGPAFDNEAIRVITGMPAWKAASMNGKPVPARISMPLTFQVVRNQKQP
jgi:protein TonB